MTVATAVPGGRVRLTPARIVQAAIKIADAEGLDAVSMQRVAGELGYAPMALYRYVPGKALLVAAMSDWAFGTPPARSVLPGGRSVAGRSASVGRCAVGALPTASVDAVGPE